MDSCRPRKLEPGLAQTYSKPMYFRTSTMKSEPGRSLVRISVALGVPDSASLAAAVGSMGGRVGADCWAKAGLVVAASAAPAAALVRNLRRSTGVLLRDMEWTSSFKKRVLLVGQPFNAAGDRT